MPDAAADRAMLLAIRDYCAAQAEAIARGGERDAATQARRRAYAAVARAAGELLAETEG